MSEAPEQVWLKEGYNSWGQYGDWWYVASKCDGVEYVRADRVKELEAKLAEVIPLLNRIKSHKVFSIEEIQDLIAELQGYKA